MGRRPVQALQNMWSAATNASIHKRRLRLPVAPLRRPQQYKSYPSARRDPTHGLICAQADLSEEVTITEQLKAAYTQMGTMAAVMIIFRRTCCWRARSWM